MPSPASDNGIVELPFYPIARLILKRHRLVMLVGKSASGKTTFAQHEARNVTGREPEVLGCSPETERTDVWGLYQLVNDKTVFADGPLPRALKSGGWLIAEEFGLAPLETRATLLTIRGQRSIVNPLNSEVIPIPESFRLVATSNPENMACRRNVAIARALYDDFQILEVPVLSTADVRRLVRYRIPEATEERLDRVMSLWEEYRTISTGKSGSDSGEEFITARAAMHLCGLLEDGMEESMAVRVALIGKFITDNDLFSAAKLHQDVA